MPESPGESYGPEVGFSSKVNVLAKGLQQDNVDRWEGPEGAGSFLAGSSCIDGLQKE